MDAFSGVMGVGGLPVTSVSTSRRLRAAVRREWGRNVYCLEDLRSLAQPLRTEPSTAPKHSTSPRARRPGSSSPLARVPRSSRPRRKQWQEKTGITVNLIEQAQAQQLQRVSQEGGAAKTGAWEIGVALPKMLATPRRPDRSRT